MDASSVLFLIVFLALLGLVFCLGLICGVAAAPQNHPREDIHRIGAEARQAFDQASREYLREIHEQLRR
jgi:hypothetical protein